MNVSLPEIGSSSPRRTELRRRGGFSLIEVAMALAVVAFSLVAVVGLLPAGMSVYNQSALTSASTQIFEKVVADARQTDFARFVYQGGAQPEQPATASTVFRVPQLRYFDVAAEEVVPAAGSLSSAEKAKVIYYVNTRIVANAAPPTSPDTPAIFGRQYLATLTVQVVANPGNRDLSYDSDQLFVPVSGMPIKTLSVQLAKND